MIYQSSHLEFETDMLTTLMEIGHLAGGYGFFAESETIFAGLAAARPNSALPHIGRAVAHLNAHRPEEAVRILREQALERDPTSELARGFLGLSLMLAGFRHEGERVIQVLLDQGGDATALKLAENLIHELTAA